ncbi:MAG: tetratricopeptide repeat protein, partial [Thermoleophilia bacterium]|nr:tetratricopeptide repeat protein [Thermoleophilia bacterium]
GDISAARDALVEGIARCPVEQRPILWKTLGDLYQARREFPAARSAFEEWAKLQPENPDPRVSLVLLAIDAGDEPAIAEAIKAVRDVTGNDGYYWRYARVEDLLRNRKEDAGAPPAERLAEARTLIDEILKADPKLPLGHVLEGRLAEAQGRVDDAIAAYRRGVSLNGGDAALNPLIALVIREKRDALIDELRRSYPGGPAEFDRLAAVQALRAGNKGRAEQLAALAVQGDPQGMDVRTWQAEVLQALGKPAEAEAALKALAEKKPTEPAPWLQLLMLRVSQGRTADALKTVEEMRAKVKTDFPELLWAQCYRAAGDAARATESYEAALRRWPNDLGVLLSAVGFFQQSGALDRADAILRGILSRDPSNRRVRRQLAESLASRPGDRAAWEEALKTIGPDASADDVPEDLLTRARVYALGDAEA